MNLFAERLKAARALNGFSLQDLADKLNSEITRQTLHNYEKGISFPDDLLMAKLCNVLNVTPDFFKRVSASNFENIEFEKLKKISVKEQYRIKEKTKDTLERYLELESILNISSTFINPIQNISINNYADVELAAEKLRELWQLGTKVIPNVIQLLEDNNIKIIEVSAEDKFEGMQTLVNDSIPVIVLNKFNLKSLDKIRFTALYELAHLILVGLEKFSDSEKEKIYNKFAAALLFSKSAAEMEFGTNRTKLHLSELGILKGQYGIPLKSIAYRAKDLGYMSENYVRQFIFLIAQLGYHVEEPFEYKGSEQSDRFMKLLLRALAEKLITIEKAAALNNKSTTEFRDQFISTR
jgi:Zn-dependent peptidase ImmA (M78 family)/DNA-binding XRE family transcriptional regulator